ncbi:U7 snRNA-associated Sm LSm10 [Brachionus plicatilis]|uniref:U7 snRNA-associated Sm LSm10 n=1 Tax=Brachionus plicatilis TaxID=10195 RepID=A0A3M7R4C9_BRAPC|nr:U7 snRNA-associated Sm LSm10 [Brachionus plicatilis]
METARQKAFNYNTLIGILKACEGKNVQIDLRNEMHLYGKVESVFSEMNITLSNACMMSPNYIPNSKTTIHYSEITIRGKNVRFVHIPDDVDMISALQKQVLNKRSFNKNEFKKRPRNTLINK